MFAIALQQSNDQYKWNRAILLILVLFMGLMLFTFRSYGISWDEDVEQFQSAKVIKWYSSLFQNREAMAYRNFYLYGSFVHVLAGLLEKCVTYSDLFAARKLMTACFGLFAILGATRLTYRLTQNSRASFFSAMLLMINPVFYGHSFINSKDIPFAAMYIWSIYYLAGILRHLPEIKYGLLIKCAVMIGLTLAIRIGGLLLYFYTFGAISISFLIAVIMRHMSLMTAFRKLATCMLLIISVSYCIMVAFWPWAQLNPIYHPFKALQSFSNFDWMGNILFEGQYIKSDRLPWYYLPKLMLLQNAEIMLMGLVFFLIHLPKRFRMASSESRLIEGVILFAMIFPVIYVIARNSILYDNYRHFLFVIPLAAVWGGIGLDFLIEMSFRRSAKLTYAVSGLLVVLALHTIWVAGRLFPYEYTYYNSLAGGPARAFQSYESDYWGISIKQAMIELDQKVNRQETPVREKMRYTVHSNMPQFSASYFCETTGRFHYVQAAKQADFLVSVTRLDYDKSMPGLDTISIGRFGKDFVRVTDLRHYSFVKFLTHENMKAQVSRHTIKVDDKLITLPDMIQSEVLTMSPNGSAKTQFGLVARRPLIVLGFSQQNKDAYFSRPANGWLPLNQRILPALGSTWVKKIKPEDVFKTNHTATYLIYPND